MASNLLHYFNFGASAKDTSTTASTKENPVRALPASWYTSPAMYEIERRAIFSRRWLFMTHSSRLKNTGDWLRYNVAGYDIIITKDRQGNVNAFHNVCRHRAYPVIEKEGSGNAKILACRYHGWSYGLNGKLAKAPGYQDLEFEKEENSLFGIHTRVDRNGFVWVNMDAKEVPEVSFEEHFENVDVQERYVESGIDFGDYELDHTYELDGHYNWKILADNFNECYHCPTTHPDIPAFLNLESFDSDLVAGHIQHHCAPTPEQVAAGVNTHSTYYFPASSMSVSRHFIMIQKFLPSSPTSSRMSYEIYRNKSSTDAEFHLIADMYERVMREDKVLCDAAQRNLDRGVFVNGQLHPKYEKAPLFFQDTVRSTVTEHWEREKREGKEVWPAKRVMRENAKVSDMDEEICRGVECAGGNGGGKEILAW
ncbi:putative Rieske 2Fe-2S family protein [Phaeosphaeriaceae sp. SRC1lsM3a]|nr:putative Rieske 2Fe-2S family protein [Stagonospora sp. SRC1lsM3a]